MRNTSRQILLGCLSALACGDQSAAARASIHGGDPVALDEQLLFVDAPSRRAFLLDIQDARPAASTTRVKLPPGATSTVRRSSHNEALVLCAGERDSTKMAAEPAALVAIEANGNSRTYTLGTTPFNALTQSDDGRYAVLYRAGGTSSRTLDNPNELVVVDLDKKPEDDAVTRKTPDGLGHTLSGVIVSPQLHIADEDRRLLVVLSAAEVTVFDLGHLDRRATIVQLDETRTVDPVQVLFAAPDPVLFVRAQKSDNIFMFRFEKYENTPLGNDFRPTINPISGGIGPRDMALFGTGIDRRLLVVAETSKQALVIDPSSSKTTSLVLALPVQHILLFDGTSPKDRQVRTRALLYGDGSTSVTFLDPYDLEDNSEDKLEVLSLTKQIVSVVPLLEDGELVLMHSLAVTLVNLSERTLTPISASSPLTGALFDKEHKRLWVGAADQPWVGTLDLSTGKTDEVLLDANIHMLVPMQNANRLAVIHNSDIGYVTLLDLDSPSRTGAISVRGFFINDILERGE
jgi:hypothetical protein